MAQIDALRGIAAVVVAGFFHIRMIYFETDGLTPLSKIAPFHWLQFNGYLFVDLFFVISGIVFTHNYLIDGRMRQGVTLAAFFKARIARLYPLHLFTLLVIASWTFAQPPNSTAAFLAHLLFLNVFAPEPTATFNGPAWSLSVEMLCYLLFAIAAIWGRVGLVATASISLAIFVALTPDSSAWNTTGLIARGLFGFFVGYLLYQFVISKQTSIHVALLFFPLIIVPFLLEGLPRALAFSAFVWPVVILFSLRSKFLSHGIFRWLGERSYSIYLVHWPIFLLIAWTITLLDISPGWYLQFMAIGLILLASNTTYRAIELPAKKYCRRAFGLS